MSVASLGAFKGDWVIVHMSSGGDWSGFSRIPGLVSLDGYLKSVVHTSFVAAVSQVGVHAPWLCLGRSDGNVVLSSVVEQVLAALETVAELGQPPGRNDLDGRLDGVESELEADLVIALARAAVGDEVAAFLLGDADLRAGNDWTSQAGSEQVATLVCGVALDGAETELLDKLLLQVENDHLQRANLERLLLHFLPRLLLADIGEEAHDLIPFLFATVSTMRLGSQGLAYRSAIAGSSTCRGRLVSQVSQCAL